MARKKPEIKVARRSQPTEEQVKALEAKAEAAQRRPASSVANQLGSSVGAEKSSLRRSTGAGTRTQPYVRVSDGTATRGTTIVFPVDLHERLRRFAFDRSLSQSEVVSEAVAAFLDAREA